MLEHRVAQILLDQQNQTFDYAIPQEMTPHIAIGMRVEVPLKQSTTKGTVLGLKESSSFALKPILRLLPDYSLSASLWQLAHWMARYYCTPLQKVLKCITPPNIRKEVKSVRKRSFTLEEAEFFPTEPKTLLPEQAKCLDAIRTDLQKGDYATHLIHGVTGSGKTEIYLQAIQEAIQLGKSALCLVPEIALTSQTIERFRARFGMNIAIFHHRRSLGERTAAAEAIQSGRANIAIGARSAIFAPAKNVGLIIIDEEHDSSYKSTEMPTYHARDIAIMRGTIDRAVVVLGSATPSLESMLNSEKNKYTLHSLTKRATGASMPKVRIIDMKQACDRSGGFTHFSEELLEAIKERKEKGEQVLLLLNRRGYHRTQLCSECRHIAECPHCDLSLTYHRQQNELRCHLCDYHSAPLRECPACAATATMEFRGFGTEHVERSLHAIFKDIKTLRMDRDTTRGKESHELLFKQFRAHQADVLIGTQMIAKGFHFPSVTLVAVLSADASLQIPDFRSGEKIFQLIAQAAGRAGRAELAGEMILQTFQPEHSLLKLAAAQDYLSFYTREMQERRQFIFPPFCRLVKISFGGPDETLVEQTGSQFRKELLNILQSETECMPLVPSFYTKVKDQYYFQFFVKTAGILSWIDQLNSLRSSFSLPRSMSLHVDVDPVGI